MLNFIKSFFKHKTAEPEIKSIKGSEIKCIRGSDNIFRDLGLDNADELLEEAESKFKQNNLSKLLKSDSDFNESITIDEPTAFTKSVKLSASNKKPETLKLDHLTKRQLEGIVKSTVLALSLSENSKEILQLERTLKVFKKALEKKVGKNG
jgi:hypothetical protein